MTVSSRRSAARLDPVRAGGRVVPAGPFLGGAGGVRWEGEDTGPVKFGVDHGTWTLAGCGAPPIAQPRGQDGDKGHRGTTPAAGRVYL